MKNFTYDEAAIAEAFQNGIICKSDYNIWLGTQEYKKLLKKSLDHQDISGSAYTNEQAKAHGVHWYRAEDRSTLRFVLKGADFNPLDLIELRRTRSIAKATENIDLLKASGNHSEKQSIIKGKDARPLQRQSNGLKSAIADGFKGITSVVNDFARLAESLSNDLRKGIAGRK